MSDTPSLDTYDLRESASNLKQSLRTFTGDSPSVETTPTFIPTKSYARKGVKIPSPNEQTVDLTPETVSVSDDSASEEKDKKEERKGRLVRAKSKSQVSFDTFTVGECAIVFSVMTIVETFTQKWRPLYLFIFSPHLWFFVLPLAATLVCIGPKYKFLSFLVKGRNIIFYLFISYTVVFILDIYPKISFR